MKLPFNVWRFAFAVVAGFALGVFITTKVLIPHLKPEITISQIYRKKVKVSDQGKFESNLNVEDLTQEANETETKNKKNRVRRRDRK